MSGCFLSVLISEALLISSPLSPSSAAPATLTYYNPTSATATKENSHYRGYLTHLTRKLLILIHIFVIIVIGHR